MGEQLHVQLRIWDGEQWNSYGQYLIDASVEFGDVSDIGTGDTAGDNIVRTLDFTLANEGIAGGQEYSPHLGQSDEEHDFQPMARVVLETAFTEPRVDPDPEDWTIIFEGFLGDRIEIDGYTINCHCRDLAKVLQDYFVEESEIFPKNVQPTLVNIDGEVKELYPAPLVIQEILDFYSHDIGDIELYTPDLSTDQGDWQFTNPDGDNYVFAIEQIEDDPWGIEYESIWDALQSICSPSGHFLGFLYDENEDEMRLTYKEPPIDKIDPDHSIEWTEDIKVQSRETSDEKVRNVVKIVYGDPPETDDELRQSIKLQDQDSIDRYGRRAMLIEEGDTRFITTQTQAELFAKHALNDLSEMTATHSVDLFYNPEIEIFDLIEIYNPLIASSNFEIAVESLRHDFTFGDSPTFTTEIIGTNKVIGGRNKWLDVEARVGAKSPIQEEEISSNRALGDPRNLEVESLVGGVGISFAKPITRRWQETEIYVSQSVPIPLIDDNLLTTTRSYESEYYRGFFGGETYYIGVRHVDTSGNRTSLVTSDPVVIGEDEPAPPPDAPEIKRIYWYADRIAIELSLPRNYDEFEIRLDEFFGD